MFTVFTPTYNRAHTIGRVYDSLCAQTLRDFEWLVVDDGSTDGTEALVANWARTADFPIRYFKQENAGKHVAHNLAAREARGQFFQPFDSDDAYVPQALEKMADLWNTIPSGERASFCGVFGLSVDQHGRPVGSRYPSSPFDTDMRELHYVHRVGGEKGVAFRTDVVRQFPFPEIRRTYMPEGVVWLEMAKSYKIRCVNEIWRIYYVEDQTTGATITAGKGAGRNAPGRLYYYVWLLDNDLEYFFRSPLPFLKAAVMLPIVTWRCGRPFGPVMKSLRGLAAKMLVGLAFPLAVVLYAYDRARAAAKPTISRERK